MIIHKKEVYRYLGYKNQIPDKQTELLIDEVIDSLCKILSLKSSKRRFALSFAKEEEIVFSDDSSRFVLRSRNLYTNLLGCREAIIFAATLGSAVDQKINRYEVMNMSKAAIAQAVAAMLIESFCDDIQQEVEQEVSLEHYYLRPRFSPGYGDLDIKEQKKIFQILECEKRIGLTLTDTYMMLPTKSVTAIIGLTKDSKDCHIGKCKQCLNKDCEFRDESI